MYITIYSHIKLYIAIYTGYTHIYPYSWGWVLYAGYSAVVPCCRAFCSSLPWLLQVPSVPGDASTSSGCWTASCVPKHLNACSRCQYIGGWGSEGASTPQPGDRFRFRSCVRACVRACGRAGDQWMDVRSRFREKSVLVTFPFSLFASGAFPFSLWADFSDPVDSANFLWLLYEFLVKLRAIQWFLNELWVSSCDSQWVLSEFLVCS